MDEQKQPTCEERIGEQLRHEVDRIFTALRISEILEYPENSNIGPVSILELRREGVMEKNEAREAFDLIQDYEGETIEGYKEGILSIDVLHIVVRVQLSWGGPSDEFEVYFDPTEHTVERIDYVFKDWFDGARRTLRGNDFEIVEEMLGHLYIEGVLG